MIQEKATQLFHQRFWSFDVSDATDYDHTEAITALSRLVEGTPT